MKASRVVNSVLYNYASLVFTTGTGFVYTAFVLHHLSHSNYGIMALTGSLVQYVGLLNLGVGLTVMKMIAERVDTDLAKEIPGIVSNALILFGSVSVIAVIAVLAFEPFAAPAFHLSGQGAHTFRLALAISIPGVAVILPSALYTGVHYAYQDYRYIATLTIMTQTISVIAGVILLLLGFGVIELVMLGTLVSILTFVLKLVHAGRRFGLRPKLRRVDWHLARQMLAVSIWVLLLNIAAQAIYSTDVVVVGAILGATAVASYQVALNPALGLKYVSDQFGAVSITAAASLNAQEAYEEVRRLLSEATRVVVATVGPGLVLFAVWGKRLIALWAGRSYVPAYPTLVVLSFALLVAAMQGTSAQLLFTLNHYRRLAMLALGEAAVNVGLSIVLGKRFGIVGVAWGTAIPITIMTVGIYVPMACKLVSLSYFSLLRRLVLPLSINAVAYVLLRLVTRGGEVFPNIATLIGACVAVFGVCFSLAILLDPKERSVYLDMMRTAVARFRT